MEIDSTSEFEFFPPTWNAESTEDNEFLLIQQLVNTAIMSVGGYWPPLNALARLLEELGEFSEALMIKDQIAMSEELADIWIISTCIANQYSARLYCKKVINAGENFESLLSKAGQIARTLNYYEGDKKPKLGEELWTIENIVSSFLLSLLRFAKSYDIYVINAVKEKLKKIAIRDANRFKKSYDPSSADSIQQFYANMSNVKCPFAKDEKVWGSQAWDVNLTIKENISKVIPSFLRFCKISERESLDAFIISAPKFFGETIANLSEFTKRILTYLAKVNPENKKHMRYDILENRWHFEFNGVMFFISTFACCYMENNSRHSYSNENTFIVFQPEHAFKRKNQSLICKSTLSNERTTEQY